MPKLLSILLLALCGCTAVQRQSVGRPIASAGDTLGQVGVGALVVSGVSVFLMPLGIGIGTPIILVGAPLHYGGAWISGERLDSYPPEL